MSGMATARRKSSPSAPGVAVVAGASRFIGDVEKAMRGSLNAPIWSLEQAYLRLSTKEKGPRRRGYLKRAALLRMVLDEISDSK